MCAGDAHVAAGDDERRTWNAWVLGEIDGRRAGAGDRDLARSREAHVGRRVGEHARRAAVAHVGRDNGEIGTADIKPAILTFGEDAIARGQAHRAAKAGGRHGAVAEDDLICICSQAAATGDGILRRAGIAELKCCRVDANVAALKRFER